MEKVFPAKAFYKVITENNSVKEVHYISSDKEGNLYLEKHNSQGINKFKLKLEE